MPTWPASLPQELHLGATITTPQNWVQNMDEQGGVLYRRPRFTAVPRTVEANVARNIYTETQWDTLWTFFDDRAAANCAGGSRTFDWTDPLPGWGATTFWWSAPPERLSIVPGATAGERLWRVKFKLVEAL